MEHYEPGDDYEPGEESVFEHLRDHPPAWVRGSDRLAGWREGLEAAQQQIIAALGDSFHSCPYADPVAGLTPQAIWELAVISAAGRLGLQIFADEDEEEEDDSSGTNN